MKGRSVGEWFVVAATFGAVVGALVLVVTLVVESIPFFQSVSPIDLFGDSVWLPQSPQPRFGFMALVSGTLLSGLVALSVALPLALGGAIHLTEFSSAGQRRRLRQVIDIVAAVPPIVYAVFALLVVIPAMRFGGAWFGDPSPFNVLGAGAVVGLMLTPLLMALTADALASVPKSRREAAYALGARPFQAIVFVVIPAAAPTIVGGVLLTGSRAVGEMVILFLIGGHQPVFALDPTAPAETLTGYLLGVADGQFAADSIASQSMFAVGLVLFVVTFISNLVGIRLRRAAWHTRAEV